MAQYSKIESMGSIGSFILGFFGGPGISNLLSKKHTKAQKELHWKVQEGMFRRVRLQAPFSNALAFEDRWPKAAATKANDIGRHTVPFGVLRQIRHLPGSSFECLFLVVSVVVLLLGCSSSFCVNDPKNWFFLIRMVFCGLGMFDNCAAETASSTPYMLHLGPRAKFCQPLSLAELHSCTYALVVIQIICKCNLRIYTRNLNVIVHVHVHVYIYIHIYTYI